MSSEQESKSQADRQLDELAYRTATICREIRSLRDDMAGLAVEEPAKSRELKVVDLMERIVRLEAEQETYFPEIITEIYRLVDAVDLKGNPFKEVLFGAEARVRLNLYKFVRLDAGERVAGSKFRGWLRKLIGHEIVDVYRRADGGSVQRLNRRFSDEMTKKYGAVSGSVGVLPSGAVEDLDRDKRRPKNWPTRSRIGRSRPTRTVPSTWLYVRDIVGCIKCLSH